MSEDLLKAILGTAQQQPAGSDQAAASDPLAGMLGALLGGAAEPGGAPAQGGADLGGLLQAMLGGAGAQTPQAGTAGSPIDLLGALMGGAAAQAPQTEGTGSPLDALGASAGGGQLGGLGALVSPILEGLCKNLGLPPQIAQIVVNFVLGTLLTGMVGGGASAGLLPAQGASRRRAQPQQLDVGALLGKMASGQTISTNYLRSTGMVQELSRQSGLDKRTATLSLQQALGALGGMASAQPSS